MIEFEHKCDACKREPDQCFCDNCLDELKKEAYDEGFSEGQKSVIKE